MRAALARLRVRLPLPASGTPARRALERPMAIACFAERAPCLPLRMSSISSRTNSPATVLADLPCRAFRRARSRVRFSGMGFPSVELPQLPFRGFKHLAPRARQPVAAAIDVEVQHRHGGAERRALSAPAVLRRTLERARYCACAALGEHAVLEIERVACAHDVRRPALRSLCHERRGAIAVPRPRLWSAAPSSGRRESP